MWKFSSLRRGKLGLSPLPGWSNDEMRSPREVFEPRSRGGTGILRDIVQVSEPVAWPLSSCSPFFHRTVPALLPPSLPPNFSSVRSSLFARFLFRLHGPRLYALPLLLPLSLSLCRLFKTLSHTQRLSLSLHFLAPCSIPFKENGAKHASETAFY